MKSNPSFQDYVLSIWGIGDDIYSNWFILTSTQESENILEVYKMVKIMAQISEEHTVVSPKIRREKLRKLAADTRLSVAAAGNAVAKFGRAYRMGTISQIFETVFGVSLTTMGEIQSNTLVHFMEGKVPITLFTEVVGEVEIVIKANGKEVKITLEAGESLSLITT